jgi:hypothetical protein
MMTISQLYPSREKAQEAAETKSKHLLNNGDTIDFDGSTCDEFNEDANCLGWDGNSRRCDCGNNRVCWQYASLSPTEWYFYAERY